LSLIKSGLSLSQPYLIFQLKLELELLKLNHLWLEINLTLFNPLAWAQASRSCFSTCQPCLSLINSSSSKACLSQCFPGWAIPGQVEDFLDWSGVSHAEKHFLEPRFLKLKLLQQNWLKNLCLQLILLKESTRPFWFLKIEMSWCRTIVIWKIILGMDKNHYYFGNHNTWEPGVF
jgi:hypothetical protein